MSGKEIPLPCRILAKVNAYCAMTDQRPYAPLIGSKAAMRELQRCAGSFFDSFMVEIFIGFIEKEASSSKIDADPGSATG